MAKSYEQEPLFEPTDEERKAELIVGGYKMTWVRGHWRKSALKPKKETEQ